METGVAGGFPRELTLRKGLARRLLTKGDVGAVSWKEGLKHNWVEGETEVQ